MAKKAEDRKRKADRDPRLGDTLSISSQINLDPRVLAGMSEDEAREYLLLQEKLFRIEQLEHQRGDFLSFVKAMWPQFIAGRHHKIMADAFERVRKGELKRLIINMPPRHTKSEFASFLLPAYLIGHKPDLKIIQATHTGELAVRFGRKTRDLVASEDYTTLFPDTRINPDSQAAGKWETLPIKGNLRGEYFAVGIGGAVAGRGADLFIIDDPHSEQDYKSRTAMDEAYDWYESGPRQRLQPGGAIVIVMTRWGLNDLTGRLLKEAAKNPKADQWEVIEFPAILPSGKPLWPEFWKLEELEAVKASLHTGPKWHAQYMQQPVSEEAALIKPGWWKVWTKDTTPQCDYIIQSYDTAFLKKETADYSAITTWGVFYPEGRINDELYDGQTAHIVLLDSVKGRFEFPDLKREAFRLYDYWQPDTVIIEGKASGLPLTQELRATGIPVQNFNPTKGQDKHARVNAVTSMFESGFVWMPDEPWAHEMRDECAAFPNGEHDDLVDSMTQALLRFRQGGFVKLTDDYEEEVVSRRYRRRVYY
jgi:predicted phage terminase large subunit-like protein